VGVVLVEPPLLEREVELAELTGLLERSRAGGGGLVVVEGAAGVGKTRLLGVVCDCAGESGFTVLRARGGELERGFAFGVVRQLFEARVASATAEERSLLLAGRAGSAVRLFAEGSWETSAPSLASFETLHGLFWLCANLALPRPLLLAIDDAHWADEASLRFVSFLARRVEELPVLVVLGARLREPTSEPLLSELVADPSTPRVSLVGLSPAGVHELVCQWLAAEAEREFSGACHRVTGGNPFLLSELIGELARDGVRGRTGEIARLSELTPSLVGRSVLLRLSRLSAEARALVEAVALLGDDVALAEAAALAGVELASARRAADVLAAVEILRRQDVLAFVHPLVRASVYEEFPASMRADGHARAARLLFDAGADPERIVAQLELAPVVGEVWAVTALRQAAAQVRGRGAPAAAAAYLRRALMEPLSDEERAELLYELGFAEAAVAGPDGLAPFKEALQLTADPRRRAVIALEIGRTLAALFYSVDATEACQAGLDALGDDGGELASQLEVQLVAAAITDLSTAAVAADRLRRIRSRTAHVGSDHRGLLAVTGCLTTTAIKPARLGADLARRALADGHLLAENPELFMYANLALLWADDLTAAKAAASQAIEQARQRGSLIELAWALTHSSRAYYRAGALADAEQDAREALELLDLWGWERPQAYALAPLVDTLIERGELDVAHDTLERHGLLGQLPTRWPSNELLHSRGRLHLARGNVHEGLSDALECGRRLAAWGKTTNPGYIPWRSTAALAHQALGDHAEATALADQEVALAREFETQRALGVALRADGLIHRDKGIERLREATTVLADTPARLEHARALTDLGAALRRGGQTTLAREPLRHGLDLARRCDATALAERARAELLTAGAKPRRDWLRGRDALTASEHRIAYLAAQGKTNREIAQALYITPRTVETHLTHAYQKLNIKTRNQLALALAPQHQPTQDLASHTAGPATDPDQTPQA
jgi:DNA-binding CsgD family transcriptional regulator